MDGEAKLPSSQDFLRHVQDAFKRHRPLGIMQSDSIKPRRLLVPQREASRSSAFNVGPTVDAKNTQDEVSLSHGVRDSLIIPPSMSGTIISMHEENSNSYDVQRIQPRFVSGCKNSDTVSSSLEESKNVPLVDGQKKVQFALENNAIAQEMEWDVGNQMEASMAIGQEVKHQNFQNLEADISFRSDGGLSSLSVKRTTEVQDQVHQFRNFLQSDFSHPMTQSSAVGPSCATTTLMNSASAPRLNSTTCCSHQNMDSHVGVESLRDCGVSSQPMSQQDMVHPPQLLSKDTSRLSAEQTAIAAQAPSSTVDTQSKVKEYDLYKDQQSNVQKQCDIPKDPSLLNGKAIEGKSSADGENATDVQSQAPLSNNTSLDVKLEGNKSEKQAKVASGKAASAPRKKNYDPDLFFKVNGKLYQRLGKIGSGGSSEVHKVISSDCTIYALKKIKLKGRDYATAYGFCQEIQYLNKLKGKNHIIQLVDYEVTDKVLLKEVMNDSMINRDGKFKEDGYIHMVLEYGEIDLAHMLSQKWKELDSSESTIDENWLRFYWQQILLAVNTIHEERIVHSDLKPANFLLVKGSLKLIDFGIAKAIMSDTTNIQRDSQVGTLSYMSPEAFMCNETDANGNIIKCGRPSDIWSLGCILYQMVYGRTPFSEYKTFWAKFKVITDPNHEITFEPLSNPWLLDLIKKCLAWDRNDRWRIPELLTHPFLVPPIPPQLSNPQDRSCKLLRLIGKSCESDERGLLLCSQLEEILCDSKLETSSHVSSLSVDQCRLLCEISNICLQLKNNEPTQQKI